MNSDIKYIMYINLKIKVNKKIKIKINKILKLI